MLEFKDEITFDVTDVGMAAERSKEINIAQFSGQYVDWYIEHPYAKDQFGYKIISTNFPKDLDTLFDSDWGWIPVGHIYPSASKDKTKWIIDQGVVKYLYEKHDLLCERIDEAKDADTLVAILAHTINEELAKWLLKMHDAEMEKTPITLYHQISKPCKGIECLGQVNLDIVQSIAQHKLIFRSC